MSRTAVTAQQTIKRTILQKFDVAGGNYETVIELAESPPNAVIGRHSHHGPEAGYVLKGDITFEFDDGRPRMPFKAGQSYQLPAELAHVARAGAAGAKAILVWVVEKDKPLRTAK